MAIYSFLIAIKNHDLELPKVAIEKTGTRQLSEMKDVLLDPSHLEFDCTIYKSFRGVCLEADKPLFVNNHLRHDLTIVPPGTLNGEFAKTYGHYHPKMQVRQLAKTYPEIYQVISGSALFLLQDGPEQLTDVKFIFGQKGDVVVIPPNFAHTTINFTKEDLVLANLVADIFEANYEIFKNKHGANFYVLENHPLTWYPNPNYQNLPEPFFVKPKKIFKKPYLYEIFKQNPSQFTWLIEPNQFPYQLNDLFEESSWNEIKMNLKT